MKRRVGILAVDSWAGGVMYTHNLVRALASLPEQERPHLTLFYSFSPGPFESLLALVDQHLAYRPWLERAGAEPTRRAVGRLWRRGASAVLRDTMPELALAARRAGVECVFPVMHVRCSLTPRPIAWIPDFQHRALPEFFTAEEIRQRDRFYGAMLAQRHDIVLSSEHARADALCYYGTPAARLHVLHFATVADPAWFKDAAPQLRRPLPDQYLMVCNQFWAHKDHGTLFEAVHLLAEQGLDVHVVCTGATEDYRRPEYFQQLQARIRSWGLESHIHILGMIAREEQIRLMRGASAIVQPSLFEGWSTVLEDARALGVPVIASDFPVHLEQNLPGALYFRRGDATDCARAIADHVARRREPQAQPKPREHAERVLGFARAFMDIVNT